jgi:hypothetical protein
MCIKHHYKLTFTYQRANYVMKCKDKGKMLD